jgi:predicted acetyltransferase
VNRWSPVEGADWAMAEFFVLAPYRRRGIGEWAARLVFTRHKGTWHVAALRQNRAAIAFWRKVVRRFAPGNHKELNVRGDDWDGRVQVFTSRG